MESYNIIWQENAGFTQQGTVPKLYVVAIYLAISTIHIYINVKAHL